MDERIQNMLNSLKNPRYVLGSKFNAIEFDAVVDGQQVVFWASPQDTMEYGRETHRQALGGVFGQVRDAIKSKAEEEIEAALQRTVDEHRQESDKRVEELIQKSVWGKNPDTKDTKDPFQ